MRRQLKTNERCWTTHIFKRLYHNHPPITFKKSTEIIEEMHYQMIDHLLKHGRPIQLRKSLGYLELRKRHCNIQKEYLINWKKTREKGKIVKNLNHHSCGYVWSIRMQFPRKFGLRLFRFIPLDRHKYTLRDKIFSGDVQ